MFTWHKEVDKLNVPAGQVLRLHCSVNDEQVALPGIAAQQAAAFVCVYSSGPAARVAVVLYLKRNDQLACYLNDGGGVDPKQAGRLFQQGLAFAESMGFILGDSDYHLLSPEEKQTFWEGLPLEQGVASAAETLPDVTEEADEAVFDLAEEVVEEPPAAELIEELEEAEPVDEAEQVESPDQLLSPAPASTPATAPPPAAPAVPSAEQLTRRRILFLAKLGRLLASL